MRDLAFTDLDLDASELGGVLDWNEHPYNYKVATWLGRETC